LKNLSRTLDHNSSIQIYATLDRELRGGLAANLRLGFTGDEVSETRRHLSVALLREGHRHAVGGGLAWTAFREGGSEMLFETFLRLHPQAKLDWGPHLQWVRQPAAHGPEGWIAGLRIRLTF